MKKLTFLCVMLLLIASCKESATDFSDETVKGLSELPEHAEKVPYEDNPNLVKVNILHVDGSASEGDYLDGERHGSWTEFHKNGLVKSVTSYINGVKQGPHVEIGERGQLEIKAYYHANELHGKWIKYERSRILEERPYKNGKLHGIVKIYYPTGTIMEESPYVEGQRHGVAKWYDQNGIETIRYTYKNGELVDK
ncbi:MAG: toxin-antitoxin system YwqK family antitoxin [Fulvivirga sp.]|nr:toxin-antitoxin system YwqK family antitoxin [Fulvivirga sp.]